MKKNLWKLIVAMTFVMVTVVCLSVFMMTDAAAVWDGSVAESYADGSGDGTTADKAKLISNESEWAYFATQVNAGNETGKYFKLTNDLVFNTGSAADWATTAPANDLTDYMVGTWDYAFMGTFDGQGHTISGAYLKLADGDGIGLFGTLADGTQGTIKNFVISNTYCYSPGGWNGAAVGQIRARSSTATIENIYVTESVVVDAGGDSVGGILGGIAGSSSPTAVTVSGCVNFGSVRGTNRVGGIVGYAGNHANKLTINNCLNARQIVATTNSGCYTGGILGMNGYAVTINYCVNLINGTGAQYNYHLGSSSSSNSSRKIKLNNCVIAYDSGSWGRNATTSNCSNFSDEEYSELLSSTVSSTLSGGAWSARTRAIDNGNGTTTYITDTWVPTGVASFAPHAPETWLGLPFYSEETRSSYSFSGTGTENDPYLITSVSDMLDLANYAKSNNFAGYYFALTTDITVNTGSSSGWASSAPANKLTPIGTESVPFCGIFDGRGHTFSGVYENTNEGGAGYGMGIFGNIGNGAVIKNFNIVNSYFIDDEWLGSVVGEMAGGTIDNIYVGSDVYVKATGNADVGGIVGGCVGTAGDSRIVKNCVFKGTVIGTGTAGTGGIIGCPSSKAFSIDNCLVTGNVSSAAGNTHVGGIFGYNNYATASVTNTVYAGTAYGAYPIGDNNNKALTISGCYSTADVTDQYKSSATGGAGVMVMPAATNYYTSGSGTSGDPYLINNWAQLIILAYEIQHTTDGFSGKYFKLNANITVNEGTASADWTPANALLPIGNVDHPFKGTFDGNKKTISGVYILTDSEFDDGTALFSQVNNATIKDLVITNSLFKTERRKVSALVGEMIGTTNISNIYVTDSVYVVAQYGNRAGLISTLNNSCGGTISNCVNAANISVLSSTSSEQNYCGGIVGNGNTGLITINDCLNLADVSGNTSVCGIAGSIANNSSRVNRCVNLGTVSNAAQRGQISSSGTSGTTVTFTDCFGITAEVGGRNTSGNYTQITVEAFINPGFISGTGSALAGTWTARSSATDNGNNTTTYVVELCVPTGVATIAPQSALYNTYTLSNFSFAGTGSSVNPYVITTAAEFNELATAAQSENFSGLYIMLGNNITVNTGSSSSWLTSAPTNKLTPIGTESVPFCGNFDGQGYTISGAYMNQNVGGAGCGMGIFGVIGNGAVIKNFRIVNSCFIDDEWIGSVVGEMSGGTIDGIYVGSDVYVKASAKAVAGGIVGGCVGTNTDSRTVKNCVFKGTVTATNTAGTGGIIGLPNSKGFAIDNCLMTGSVSSAGGTTNVGGIFGYNNYATASVTNTVYAGSGYGAYPIGNNNSKTLTISGCYSTANVTNQYKSSATGSAGVTVMPSATSFCASGTGTSGDPYIISNWGNLIILAYETFYSEDGFAGKYFRVSANITLNDGDASTWDTTAPAKKLLPIGTSNNPFRGVFDGNGKTFSGIYMDLNKDATGAKANDEGVALFGYIGAGADIKNFAIANSCFVDTGWVASAVAQATGGTSDSPATINIRNIFVGKDVVVKETKTGNSGTAGGILAGSTGDTFHTVYIDSCVFGGTLKVPGNYVGGIAGNGNNSNSTTTREHLYVITKCVMAGYIDNIGGKTDYVCGILGRNDKGSTITDCIYAGTGSITYPIGNAVSGTLTVTNTYSLSSSKYYKSGNSDKSDGVTVIELADIAGSTIPSGFSSSDWFTTGYTSTSGDDTIRCIEVIMPKGVQSFAGQTYVYKYMVIPTLFANYEEDTEFTITSKAEFDGFVTFFNNNGGNFEGKTVILATDIIYNSDKTATVTGMKGATEFTPIGSNSVTAGTGLFAGEFDGQGHKISGLYVVTPSAYRNAVGLFAGLQSGAYVHDILFTNCYFEGYVTDDSPVGIIPYAVGTVADSDIEIANIYIDDTCFFKGLKKVGGVVGQTTGDAKGTLTLTIHDCVFAGTAKATYLEGAYNAGGIIGLGNGAGQITITDCLSIGTVYGGQDISGIAVSGGNTTINRCVDLADLTGSHELYGYRFCGGANASKLTLTNSYYLSSATNGTLYSGITTSNVNAIAASGLVGGVASSVTSTLSGWTVRNGADGKVDIIMPSGVAEFAPATKYGGNNIDIMNGAQVRVDDQISGMRFIAKFSKTYIDGLVSTYGAENVERGVIIAPKQYVTAAGAFTVEALEAYEATIGKRAYIDVEAITSTTSGNYYVSKHMIGNIKAANYDVEFTAMPYVKVGDTYYYGNNAATRKVSDVAWSAIMDVKGMSEEGYTNVVTDSYFTYKYSPYTATQRTALLNYIGTKPITASSEYATPESMGISSENIAEFIQAMMDSGLSTHSIIVARHGKIVSESYADGYDANSLQRLYSTSKSYVSMAIGMLEKEGRLSLDDKLSKYFGSDYPQSSYPTAYSTTHGTSVMNTTIRQLLKMSSPYEHSSNVYSFGLIEQTSWLERFFQTEVEKDSEDDIFAYDTAATHVLGSIVKKITGKEFLEYMIDRCFNQIGYVKSTNDGADGGNWCVRAPEGTQWGGSGVMATTKQLFRFGEFVMNGGSIGGTQYVNTSYVRAATTKQIQDDEPLTAVGGRGYGYQIWITDDGFAFEGMGNQLIYAIPELDFMIAVTSDNQGNGDAYDIIYKLMDEYLVTGMSNSALPANAAGNTALDTAEASLRLPVQQGANTSDLAAVVGGQTFTGGSSGKITSFSLDLNTNTLTYTCHGESGKTITFGVGSNVFGTLNETGSVKYNSTRYSVYSGKQIYTTRASEGRGGYRTAASGAWTDDNTFTIHLQVVDEYLANVDLVFTFADDGQSATLTVTNISHVEGFMKEYNMTDVAFSR